MATTPNPLGFSGAAPWVLFDPAIERAAPTEKNVLVITFRYQGGTDEKMVPLFFSEGKAREFMGQVCSPDSRIMTAQLPSLPGTTVRLEESNATT